MLYNSPTAGARDEITHSYSGSVNFGPLLFDALPNFFPRGLLHFWPHCFHCVARYGETSKQGARIAMPDRLTVSLTCVLFSLNLFVCNIASKLPPRLQHLGQEPVSSAMDRMKVLGIAGFWF